MKPLSTIPATRPAVRSRNEGYATTPRSRSQMKMASVEGRKQVYVDFLQAGLTTEEAAERVRTELQTIREWAGLDAEFEAKCAKAIQDRRLLTQGRVSGYMEEALDVMVKRGMRAKGAKLAVDTAHKMLRGGGVLPGEGVQVAVGVQVNPPPKIINLLPAEPGKPYREIVDTDGNGS